MILGEMGMVKLEKNILNFADRDNWRSWLDNNHGDSTEAWIVIQKKDSPAPGLFLDEAVEEALCYGWIDSTLNTKDDHSYLLRFSPRKPHSVWSISNIRRVRILKKDGRLMPPGLTAIQEGKKSGAWQAAIDRENPDYVPPELAVVFDQDPDLSDAFHALPVSEKKRYVYWLQSAKKKETKQKRITEILGLIREEMD
jgi:uncharacterized protein YdeI (YjbR/CyaY-like superfamily)